MKLITEAEFDDKFNVEMAKIQDAIQKLEDLIEKDRHTPVGSQVRALERASHDLGVLATHYQGLRVNG